MRITAGVLLAVIVLTLVFVLNAATVIAPFGAKKLVP